MATATSVNAFGRFVIDSRPLDLHRPVSDRGLAVVPDYEAEEGPDEAWTALTGEREDLPASCSSQNTTRQESAALQHARTKAQAKARPHPPGNTFPEAVYEPRDVAGTTPAVVMRTSPGPNSQAPQEDGSDKHVVLVKEYYRNMWGRDPPSNGT